jgi:hypothetical protein
LTTLTLTDSDLDPGGRKTEDVQINDEISHCAIMESEDERREITPGGLETS